jgi:hypothetical protein
VFRVSECFGLFRVFRTVISDVSDVPDDIVLLTVSVISNQAVMAEGGTSVAAPVNVWLQSRSLPARGRVDLEVHRCC